MKLMQGLKRAALPVLVAAAAYSQQPPNEAEQNQKTYFIGTEIDGFALHPEIGIRKNKNEAYLGVDMKSAKMGFARDLAKHDNKRISAGVELEERLDWKNDLTIPTLFFNPTLTFEMDKNSAIKLSPKAGVSAYLNDNSKYGVIPQISLGMDIKYSYYFR